MLIVQRPSRSLLTILLAAGGCYGGVGGEGALDGTTAPATVTTQGDGADVSGSGPSAWTEGDTSAAMPAPTTTSADEGSGSDGAVASSSSGAPEPDVPPEPSLGDIRWLVDGETGQWGDSTAPHDGANRNGCLGQQPESALLSSAVPRHTGDFAVELRLEASWAWGEPGCSPGGGTHARVLLLSGDIYDIEQDAEVWIGWAVRVPDAWEPGQRIQVMQMHRGGYGPHYWVEVSADMMWQLTARAPIPDLNRNPRDIAPVVAGQWHEFVTHTVLSQDAALGSITVWEKLASAQDWTLALEYAGPTAAPEEALQFGAFPADAMFSVEMTGGDWSGQGDSYFLQLDEMRVGGPDSSFDEVAPGSNVVIEL